MSSDALDDRIVAVLKRANGSPAAVASVIADAELALPLLREDLARVREVALNPLTPASEVAEHRARVVELRFGAERLEAGLERLRQKHEQALARVEAERRAAAHAAIVARRDELAAKFESVWATLAVPLASFLHEVAAVDGEINAANRLKLGVWIDKVETVARPGVGDIDTHKLTGMHTRLAPWDHDQHRAGELLWPPQPPKLNPAAMVPGPLRQLEEAVAAGAREASAARAQAEAAHRAQPQRRKVVAGW